MVKQLAEEYAGRPVVFLEEDVDAYVDAFHYGAWWAANAGRTGLMLPLIVLGSGSRHTSGPVDFEPEYRKLIDTELARPPAAEVTGSWRRSGDGIHAAIGVVNRSGTVLSDRNAAQVGVIVYEIGSVGMTGRRVRGFATGFFPAPVADGGAATVAVDVLQLKGVVDWTALHVLALVDYKPEGSTRWDNLQAATLLLEPQP